MKHNSLEECSTRTLDQTVFPQQFVKAVKDVAESVSRCTHETESITWMEVLVNTDRPTETRWVAAITRGSEMFARKQGSKWRSKAEGLTRRQTRVSNVREQGKMSETKAEEPKKMIDGKEAYFVYNGRILKVGEVNGLRDNVIVNAVRMMNGGWKKQVKKTIFRVKFFGDRRYQDGRDADHGGNSARDVGQVGGHERGREEGEHEEYGTGVVETISRGW